MDKFDLIVVGAGPGGYIAAERAGAAGKKVLLIEKEALGGICTNHGCIPTKSLLNAAKHFVHGIESAKYGVHFDNPVFKLSEAMAWKRETITGLQKGIAFLMKQHKVEVVFGQAEFPSGRPGAEGFPVIVDGVEYRGDDIILATGSKPFVPPIPGHDLPHVLTSRQILGLEELPKKLVVIGGGVIGVEFASFFSNVGVEVHVVEMMDEICPMMDRGLAGVLRKEMKAVKFHLGARVESIDDSSVTFDKNGEKTSLEADVVLMSVGRRPNIEGLEGLGLDMDGRGIKVDEKMRTNIPGIWAVGDVTGESLLAHSASRMGEVAVANMTGGNQIMRYNAVPWAVYTIPEVAGCGLTEAEAKEKGFNVKSAAMPMKANGRFLAEYGKKAGGQCKVVVDADTDLILGIHMAGGLCSEMIGAAATFIEAELRVQEIKEIIFPHPSVSEIIKDTIWNL
ncbi:MAG: dihydrolipoyl dehydrogenase [Spirochaetales bacterium]|nr:dihydrolipoyl dehydrogenase [Spirochaetales bacterium]